MEQSPTADRRAARLATRQLGLLTSRQAASIGLTRRQVERRVNSGAWVVVAPGLYRIAGTPRSWRQDALAAVLACHAPARASHMTALAMHGLGRAPVLPHVTVPPTASARTRLAKVHRAALAPVDRGQVDGIPCTSVSRALVDAAGILPRVTLEAMVDEALCSGRASVASVRDALSRAGRQGRAGAALIASVLGVWSEPILPGSPAEVRFLRLLVECGVHDAVTQFEVRDARGSFVARVDVASPCRRRIWEYDSDRWHGPRRWADDEDRQARLVALGWTVDRVSKLDVLPSATRVRASLAA